MKNPNALWVFGELKELESYARRHISLVDYCRKHYVCILKTHYVAIVPADLRSAGMEYKNRRSAQLIWDPLKIPII